MRFVYSFSFIGPDIAHELNEVLTAVTFYKDFDIFETKKIMLLHFSEKLMRNLSCQIKKKKFSLVFFLFFGILWYIYSSVKCMQLYFQIE